MKFSSLALFALTLFVSAAFAEQSEFKAAMQKELDSYISTVKSKCGITVKMAWSGNKFAVNPNEPEKPEWYALTTLCTSGIDALSQACDNEEVKKAVAGIKELKCKSGKGPLAYTKSKADITFTVDGSFTDNNPAGQISDLVTKMKKDLDV